MMERSMMGVASPLLCSVEGVRVGDGGAHGTVGRSELRATGRQTVGAAAVYGWRRQAQIGHFP
jgi:hypothetical protein